MIPSEVADLVALVIGLDARLQCDGPTLRNRVGAWAQALGDVDAAWAKNIVRRHYQASDAPPITSGLLLARWAALPTNRERPQLPTGPGVPMPAEIRALIRGGRQASPEDVAVIRAVACPWPPCSAPIGHRCTTTDGTRDVVLARPHDGRTRLASTATEGAIA